MSGCNYCIRDRVWEEEQRKKKIPCQTVEMMIEPKYCDDISNNGTFCCCDYTKRMKKPK